MRFALLAVILSGCSSLGYRSPGPYNGGRLIGTGTVLAEVWLAPRGGEEQRFNALISRTREGMLFNALSPSGKQLYRVRDALDPARAPDAKAEPTELAIPPARLEGLYRALRPLFFPVPAGVASRYPDERPRELSAGRGFLVTVDEYDWAGHAFRVRAEGDGWYARLALREFSTGN
jgi:hypothetical protein